MKKSLAMPLISLMALAIALPARYGAAAVTSTINGTVTGTGGSPVEGATIIARDAQGNVIQTAVTDAQGNYSMELPVGVSYELDPPAAYGEATSTGSLAGVMTAESQTVNWQLATGSAVWIPILVGTSEVAASVGLAVGLATDDNVQTESK